jgi:hypothetical protein
MDHFSIFDTFEELMMLSTTYLSSLQSNEFIHSDISPSVFNHLIEQFTVIQRKFELLINLLINSNAQLTENSKDLSKITVCPQTQTQNRKRIKRSKLKYLIKDKPKRKNLVSPFTRLKKIIRKDVKEFEISLENQQKTYRKLSSDYISSLKEIENELSVALEMQKPLVFDNSNNSSMEFDQVMQEINLNQDMFISNSRISLDKTIGGWVSDYESSSERSFDNERIISAISLLIKADLIGADRNLSELTDIMNDDQGLEGLCKNFSQLGIKSDKRNDMLENTATDRLVNNIGACYTILTPGHKRLISFTSSDFE